MDVLQISSGNRANLYHVMSHRPEAGKRLVGTGESGPSGEIEALTQSSDTLRSRTKKSLKVVCIFDTQ